MYKYCIYVKKTYDAKYELYKIIFCDISLKEFLKANHERDFFCIANQYENSIEVYFSKLLLKKDISKIEEKINKLFKVNDHNNT